MSNITLIKDEPMADGCDLELWGGLECTINRVGDRFYDQIAKSGHEARVDDIDALADLGIKALRYPVLWERYCQNVREVPDCSLAKGRLYRLMELGVQPIVGLLHHGGGPSDTSLIDQDFPARFADYAYAIAQQLRDVSCFTPINEPLTTARFSGLYGHWYPHARDDASFLKALFNQIEATQLAMQAIKSVNPTAALIQTENLDQSHSTRCLQYQADFENNRRWLSIDLLLGRFGSSHPLWSYVERDLNDLSVIERLHSNAVSIDILGWNYYLTGERFLDHRLDRYPRHNHGGNGRDKYADVEAIRVMKDGIHGLGGLLRQAWKRYPMPMAITEVHLGCHRESQIRWILDNWQLAHELKGEGIDLRAMTVWNLLGCFDWDSLCTLSRSHYESGAFDTRSGRLRPTRVATLLKKLASSSVFEHPAVPDHGWWERPDRLINGCDSDESTVEAGTIHATSRTICESQLSEFAIDTLEERPPLLITGGNGTLGKAFGEMCRQRRIPHLLMTRCELDVTEPISIKNAIERHQPWAIVNTAGYVRVDHAEHQREECLRSNTYAARLLAEASAKYDIPFVTYSTDLVFDGNQNRPYVEHDASRALNMYGQSKILAEQEVLAAAPQSLVIRTSSFFGPWDEFNFLTSSLQQLQQGQPVYAINDWIVSPTYVPHLVNISLDLLIDGVHGIWHLVNDGQLTWHAFLWEAASNLGFETHNIIGQRRSESRFVAKRPAFSALTSRYGTMLPSLSESIQAYCSQWHSIANRNLAIH